MDTANLRRSTKFLLGGLGALAPILASFAILDHETIKHYFEESTMKLAGYSFRIIVLFTLGGIWAFLHKSEEDPIKLFQLGIVGPALITGMINANNAVAPSSDHVKTVSFSFSIIQEAYASGDNDEDDGNDFIDGILGK